MTEVMEKTWRQRAKELGVSLMKEPLGTGARKKAEVLADIEAAEAGLVKSYSNIAEILTEVTEEEVGMALVRAEFPDNFTIPVDVVLNDTTTNEPFIAETCETTLVPECEAIQPVAEIEPIDLHEPWQNDGRKTEVEPLMRRIETLENRFNLLIDAISKSKKVRDI